MNNEYSTKDLHFAAYLYIKGAVLNRLEKRTSEYRDRNPIYFIFEDKQHCLDLDRRYWDGKEQVSIKDYIATIRDLRARAASVNYQAEQPKDEQQEQTS